MSHREVCSVKLKIKRRSRVIGIFANDAASTSLVGAVLMEQDEHCQLEGRHMFSAASIGRHRSARESAGPIQQSRLRGTKP
jgi:transposase-like protein